MQPSELPGAIGAHILQHLRHQAPLVHCLTHDIVQTLTANTLLALGASPALVVEPEDAAQFGAIADALLINLDTLCQQRAAAMLAGPPWVLDPVGVSALHYRTDFARHLLTLHPAATPRKSWRWTVLLLPAVAMIPCRHGPPLGPWLKRAAQ